MEGRKSETSGYLGLYKLNDWWVTEFTDSEREYIENKYKPMGSLQDEKPLTQGAIERSSASASNFLNGIESWFEDREHVSIALRMTNKARELNRDSNKKIINILDEHFSLTILIPLYYRDREEEGMLDKTIEVCKLLIALAPDAQKAFLGEYPEQGLPSHRGYEQLAIIYDKQGKINQSIILCKKAKEQGWFGDWDKRIARYEKKLLH